MTSMIVKVAGDSVATAAMRFADSIGGDDGGGHAGSIVAGDQNGRLSHRGNLEIAVTGGGVSVIVGNAKSDEMIELIAEVP